MSVRAASSAALALLFASAAAARTLDDFSDASLWKAFAQFNGVVGVLTMIIAVFLTIYSLAVYMRSFSSVLAK